MKYFSLGGGGTDGTTQSLPWIECASSPSTPGSCDKQMLNDQFEEIFYIGGSFFGDSGNINVVIVVVVVVTSFCHIFSDLL